MGHGSGRHNLEVVTHHPLMPKSHLGTVLKSCLAARDAGKCSLILDGLEPIRDSITKERRGK